MCLENITARGKVLFLMMISDATHTGYTFSPYLRTENSLWFHRLYILLKELKSLTPFLCGQDTAGHSPKKSSLKLWFSAKFSAV